jgi:DNA polymerase-3 subunit alpha
MGSFVIVPIHNHSEYSALDGFATTKEIAERCVEIGCPACGLSDHGTVAGHLDFSKTMREHGVKPIFACELYHGLKSSGFKGQERDQAHFLAGALTDEGLKNLWRLVDASASFFRFVGRVNWDMLPKYSEGLFATSACIQGLVSKELYEGKRDALNRYLDIFKDNFYIEIHTYPAEEQKNVNVELVTIAQERGIPLIYATDAHFAHPDQYLLHDSYVAMSTGDSIYTDPADRKMWHPKALYIQDEDEIRENLAYLGKSVVDEIIVNSTDLAERVNADLPDIKRHLPTFVPSHSPFLDNKGSETADKVFFDLVEEGIYKRYGENPGQEIWDRAAQELEVFLDAGLEHYFLQAWDFLRFCDEEGIQRGPGRGSAGGAIVSYALGITDVDPLTYGLIFERFYNAGREKGFPDIDNDFPTKERKKIRKYLEERWGKDRVRMIGNIGRLKPKAVVDRTWKACGADWAEKEELKSILNRIPDLEIHGPDTVGWDESSDPGKTIYVTDHVGQDILDWIAKKPQPRQKVLDKWLVFLKAICSRVETYGVHASGVVVSDDSLAAELPSRWAAGDIQDYVTMFPMADVDTRGFVKQDLLGLRNLDTLQEWVSRVDEDIQWSGLETQEHPEEMWKLLDQGLSQGIFQIESGYARQLAKKLKPRSVEDLGLIVALNRPGPIRANAGESFVRRRDGEEEITYDHPFIEDILEPTYGHFVYQEQVIAYFNKLGYNLNDSDAVRKILGKKKPEQLDALYNGIGEWDGKGYLEVATEQLGDPEVAKLIWNKIEGFASYSFNKSHAIEYAVLTFRTLYAKYTHTPEFIIACLRTNPSRAADYVAEGRRMGINVKPPVINRSKVHVDVVDGDILFGFANIHGIGPSKAEYVMKLQRNFDISSPEKMADALAGEQQKWQNEDKSTRNKQSPHQRFSPNLIPLLYNAGAWDAFEERSLSMAERQKIERELFKIVLTDNSEDIFQKHPDKLAKCDTYASSENGNEHFKLPGVITNLDEKFTKKGRKPFGIVTIEYHGDELEFVVFNQHWQSYKFLWKDRAVGIFGVKKTDRGFQFDEGTKLT